MTWRFDGIDPSDRILPSRFDPLDPPWLVPLQGRKIAGNEWKFVIHLFCWKMDYYYKILQSVEMVSNLQRKFFWPESSTHDLPTLILRRTFRSITRCIILTMRWLVTKAACRSGMSGPASRSVMYTAEKFLHLPVFGETTRMKRKSWFSHRFTSGQSV